MHLWAFACSERTSPMHGQRKVSTPKSPCRTGLRCEARRTLNFICRQRPRPHKPNVEVSIERPLLLSSLQAGSHPSLHPLPNMLGLALADCNFAERLQQHPQHDGQDTDADRLQCRP